MFSQIVMNEVTYFNFSNSSGGERSYEFFVTRGWSIKSLF